LRRQVIVERNIANARGEVDASHLRAGRGAGLPGTEFIEQLGQAMDVERVLADYCGCDPLAQRNRKLHGCSRRFRGG